MAPRTVPVLRAETGETLQAENVPDRCLVKGFKTLLATQHGPPLGKTELLVGGKYRTDDAVLFDSAASANDDVVMITLGDAAAAPSRPAPLLARDASVETFLTQVQAADWARLTDAQVNSTMQSMQNVFRSANDLIRSGFASGQASQRQDGAAHDWIRESQRHSDLVAQHLPALQERFNSIGAQYNLISEMGLGSMLVHPAVGTGSLADTAVGQQRLATLQSHMSEQEERDERGAKRIKGKTRRNVNRMPELLTRYRSSAARVMQAYLGGDNLVAGVQRLLQQLDESRRQLGQANEALETERTHWPKTVTDPQQRQMAVARIEQLVKATASEYRKAFDTVQALATQQSEISHRVSTVFQSQASPMEMISLDSNIASYENVVRGELTTTCRQLLELPLNYGLVLIELLRQNLFNQLLQAEGGQSGQMLRALTQSEVERRSRESLPLLERVMLRPEAERVVAPIVDVRVQVTPPEATRVRVVVRPEDVQAYIRSLERFDHLRDAVNYLNAEMTNKRLSDLAQFRQNFSVLNGPQTPVEASGDLRQALKDKEEELQQVYKTIRQKDGEIRALQLRVQTVEGARSGTISVSDFHVVEQPNLEASIALQTTRTELANAQRERDELRERVLVLTRELAEARAARVNAETACAELQRQLEELQRQAAALGEEGAQLQSAQSQMKDTLREREARVADLLETHEGLQAQLRDAQAKIKELQDEKERNDNDFLYITTTKEETQRKAAEEQERRAAEAIAALEERVNKISDELQLHKASNEALHAQLAVGEQEKTKLAARVQEMQKALDDVQHSMGESQAVSTKTQLDLQNCRKELDAASAGLTSAQAEGASLRAQLAKASAVEQELRASVQALERSRAEMAALLEQAKNDNALLTHQKKTLEIEHNDTVHRLETALEAARQEGTLNQQSAVSKLNERIKALHTHVAKSETGLHERDHKIAKLTEMNQMLNANIGAHTTDLNLTRSELRDNKERVEQLAGEVAEQERKLMHQKESFDAQMEALRQAYRQAAAELKAAQDRARELKSHVDVRDRQLHEVSEENTQLQGIIQALQENSFHAPQPHLEPRPEPVAPANPNKTQVSVSSFDIGDRVLFLPTQQGTFAAFAPLSGDEYMLDDVPVDDPRGIEWLIGEVVYISPPVTQPTGSRRFSVMASVVRSKARSDLLQ